VTDGAPVNADARLNAFDELQRLEASDVPQRRPWSLWLLLVPMLAIAYPPLYSRTDPTIGGIPFFVWYLILAVVFGGLVTGVVYFLRGTEGGVLPPGEDA
jgi:hypothetical protein